MKIASGPILVVEDVPNVLELLEETLRSQAKTRQNAVYLLGV